MGAKPPRPPNLPTHREKAKGLHQGSLAGSAGKKNGRHGEGQFAFFQRTLFKRQSPQHRLLAGTRPHGVIGEVRARSGVCNPNPISSIKKGRERGIHFVSLILYCQQ